MSYKKKSNYSNYPKKNIKNQNNQIKRLMHKYNIDRATAVQIDTGVISLEMWLEKRQEEKEKQKAKELFIQKIEEFLPDKNIAIDNSILLLKEIFKDPIYQNQKKSWFINEKQATQLAKEHGISIPIARSIVNKKFSLDDYLVKEKQKQDRKEKAQKLHSEYPDIAIETCYKLVDNDMSVEDYHQAKSKKQEKRNVWYKNYLKDNLQDNEPLNNYLEKLRKTKTLVSFHLYGLKSIVGTIYSYTPYEIKVHINKKLVTVHKLELKYFHRQRNDEHILKSINTDSSLQKNPLLPSSNTKERFSFPEEMGSDQKIMITLGEGEQISGFVNWVSKYDLKLKLEKNSNISVMLFKHAIIKLELV